MIVLKKLLKNPNILELSLENLSKLSSISNHGINQNVTNQSYSDVSSDSVNSVVCRGISRGCCGSRGWGTNIDIDIDVCIGHAFGDRHGGCYLNISCSSSHLYINY
ncbi:hypothetical protein DFA_06301 [Cavenderia fasciculata]|uniref:Uncharacterized protein n=1 Tax=Cavenderia fasciculata TaxID=261658 RepID=F4PKN1_CACFS|nr:uncharacterized protein DFA_06301 [Cavenderia fasciculata]EGG24155.1 hypothetical protein DFA_06301 [Cavenderia fasciculata]|eukprot:XP_004362006.1 hypothetical protein DFA_06301 [Cavenderia fasciculata]